MISPTNEKRSLTELYGVELYAPTAAPLQQQMERLAVRMGGSFYVLPHTARQMLLCSENRLDRDYMDRIVQQCQHCTTIPIGVKLKKAVYHYDAKKRLFELASDYRTRVWNERCDWMSRRDIREDD
jgi:hypothetical protein